MDCDATPRDVAATLISEPAAERVERCIVVSASGLLDRIHPFRDLTAVVAVGVCVLQGGVDAAVSESGHEVGERCT